MTSANFATRATGALQPLARTADFPAGAGSLGRQEAHVGTFRESAHVDDASPSVSEALRRVTDWVGKDEVRAGVTMAGRVAGLLETFSLAGRCPSLDQIMIEPSEIRRELVVAVVREAFAHARPEAYFQVIVWAADVLHEDGKEPRGQSMARLAVDMADWLVEQGLDPLAELCAEERQAFGRACELARRHPEPDVRIRARPVGGRQSLDRPSFLSGMLAWFAWLAIFLLGAAVARLSIRLFWRTPAVEVVAVERTDKARSATDWLQRLGSLPEAAPA
ncbi:MAG: hypothetical protein VKO21_02920 [Candidatus Sericytochromatia bacterium]|nr:hypothetical protein [Candidatus Sericytochromatia bacterium]